MSAIGSRILSLRKQKKMSQDELAKICNTCKQTIYKYEKGVVTNIPLDRLELIADALGTTSAYLMGWTENEHPTDPQADEVSEERREFLQFIDTVPDAELDRLKRMILLALKRTD